ncbi:MAG: AAA family ATPase [Limisphaerales bacterium]
MIERAELLGQVEYGLQRNPVMAILGPRQCGKTTLAREVGRRENAVYFDLEDPNDQARLANPQLVLEAQRGLVILDEIQRRPAPPHRPEHHARRVIRRGGTRKCSRLIQGVFSRVEDGEHFFKLEWRTQKHRLHCRVVAP